MNLGLGHLRGPASRQVSAQFVAFVVSRGVLLASTVIVARAAGVEAYGGFALALVVFQAGLLLRDAGLGQALVVRGARTEGLTWPSFVLTSGFGVGLAAVMALAAVPLSSALGVAEAAPILIVLSAAFAIGSFGVASSAGMQRSLRFVSLAWLDIAAYLTLGIVTVIGISSGLDAMALALGYVAQGVVQAAGGILLLPPWTDRGATRGEVRRLVAYSSVLWVSATLSYFATNIDNVLVGALGGATPLGVYAISYTIGNTITIGLAQVLNRVALPYYARSALDGPRTIATLRTVVPFATGLAAVPAIVIALLAPEIGSFVLGPAAPTTPLVLLAAYGVVRAVGLSLGTALNGLGAAPRTARGSGLNVLLMAIAIPPAFLLAGTTGVAAVVLGAILVATTYLSVGLDRMIDAGLTRQLAMWSILGLCAIIGVLMLEGTPLPLRLALGAPILMLLAAWLIRVARLSRAGATQAEATR